MSYRRRPDLLTLSTALPLVLAAGTAARAEDIKLDEITVSSPSPIVTRPATAPATGSGVPIGVLPVVTNTFSPVTVVTQEQIARDQPRTLGDALFDRPGISSTTYAPGAASRPIIRGLDNAGCASRRTASSTAACRISARTTPSRSTRWWPTGSR